MLLLRSVSLVVSFSHLIPSIIRRARVSVSTMESREEEMNIYLKVIKTIALKVNTSETIKNLKSILHEKEGISENLQELFFTGEQLKDDQKLVDYGIQTNSTLHLVLQNLDSIKFYVHIPSYQKTFELEAKNSDTIQNIKSLVLAKEGIQSDRYNLFYSGMLLEDNKTLASLKIQGGSLLYLIFNPSDVLSVFVKMSTGEMVKPEVKVLYTIGDVKAIVGSMVGFSVSDQSLIYAGKQLEDGKTLASYNIRENTMLEMSPSAFQIFVKDWNGKTVILDVHPLDTVEGVKIKIFNKLHMPVKVQGLVFAGKRLENDRDLVSYNIQKHSTLHMVFWPTTWVKKMKVSDIEGLFFGLQSSTTIRGLKALIEKMLKKPVKEVSIAGLALQDHSSLADYAIEQNTELTIAMEVF